MGERTSTCSAAGSWLHSVKEKGERQPVRCVVLLIVLAAAGDLARPQSVRSPWAGFPQPAGEPLRNRRLQAPQAITKIIAGAAVALFGILLVQHGILSLVSAQDSGHLIGVAVLFGFAQQLVTQVVTQAADKRAAELVGAAPSTRVPGSSPSVSPPHSE